jgi:GMP synthase-like glutamine amidotransferase
MKLSILQTGDVPEPLRHRFGPYATMFQRMFDAAGAGLSYEVVPVSDGAPLPDPDRVEAVLITGSPAGVYDDLPWLDPLRDFIRAAHGRRTPMLGICFGHQIMADALGGVVRKSEKGWGLGRHSYEVMARPAFMQTAPAGLAVSCSHQDQVVTAPEHAQTMLASAFTPHAGLAYRNGAAVSLQAHPEFTDEYALALAEMRQGTAPDDVVAAARASFATPSDSREVANYLSSFLGAR